MPVGGGFFGASIVPMLPVDLGGGTNTLVPGRTTTDQNIIAQLAAINNLAYLTALQKTMTKNKQDKKTIKILSASSIELVTAAIKTSDSSAAGALTSVLDSTTYPDRAILTLYNGLGYNVYLTKLVLHGNLKYQYSGENGELLHDSLKRDDDIRRNGERCLEIGNNFIVDATQCAKIADYWFKYSRNKHIYSVTIPGTALWYSLGEWYNLELGGAGTNEYISSVVECYSINCERSAGTIGTTTIMFREVLEDWAKTTLYATRLVSGGSPKRRVNRSNIVTVASSTYDGTYDYRCDGTDDDVQIQAAIDYVASIGGGGIVQLMDGTYNITSIIVMKTNIVLQGVGTSTIITNNSADPAGYISTAYDCDIKDLMIDGNDVTSTAILNGILISADVRCTIERVEIKRLKTSKYMPIGTRAISGISSNSAYLKVLIINVYVHDLASIGASNDAAIAGIWGGSRVISCRVEDITSSGTGSDIATGIGSSKKCANNTVGTVTGSTTYNYYSSYADAGTTNACADTYQGGYNS